MAKISVSIEYEVVCPNCYRPLDFFIHEGTNPKSIAVPFCQECVEEKIKSAIESERKRIHRIIQDATK